MRRPLPALRATLLCAALAALGPRSAAAQADAGHLFRTGSVALSLLAGGAAFSSFQRVIVPLPEGGQFERRISAATSPALALELFWWFSPLVGARLHGSFLPSRFDVRDEAADGAELPAGNDSVDWRSLDLWIADLAVLVRAPGSIGRVYPYAVLGGGLVSYRPHGSDPLPPEAAAAFADGGRTRPAALVGLGTAVPLQRERLVLSFVATNHLTRTPVPTGGETDLTSHVRLLIGLTVPLRSGR